MIESVMGKCVDRDSAMQVHRTWWIKRTVALVSEKWDRLPACHFSISDAVKPIEPVDAPQTQNVDPRVSLSAHKKTRDPGHDKEKF
nr:hypothetical protein [Rhodopirellula sp. SM50]